MQGSLSMISFTCCSGAKGKGWISKMKFSQKKSKRSKGWLGNLRLLHDIVNWKIFLKGKYARIKLQSVRFFLPFYVTQAISPSFPSISSFFLSIKEKRLTSKHTPVVSALQNTPPGARGRQGGGARTILQAVLPAGSRGHGGTRGATLQVGL